jgi:7,8-dihydro-6-hydroxymethylpterin dimethyltransferase
MSKAIKYAEKAAVYAAQGAWAVSSAEPHQPQPFVHAQVVRQAAAEVWQKEKPPLGWPRTTDSLCPKCVPEIRKQIIDGKLPHEVLLNEKVGEIKAQIIERDGKILMVKDCPKHGHFEDVMSIDTAFFKHLEEVFPGRDIRAHNDEKLHNHGTSTVTHGRGSVLTIDLTNRCNMMCDPCFMDANQVGFVHELTWDEIKTMLDNAITIKPRRQMSCSSPAASRRCRRTSSTRSPTRARLATTACRRRPTASSSPRARSSAAAAEAGLRYAYCSSTASATRPTRTARSATCST